MTMIRRTVMDELKWADWTICEDAELGLRVFKKATPPPMLTKALVAD